MLESSYITQAIATLQVLEQEEISDINSYILKNPLKWDPEKLRILADQWNFKKKSKEKLGPWHAAFEGLIGPPKLSWEQASSYWTSQWKAEHVHPGERWVDMTGGWGMDSLFFAKAGAQVTHCELQPILSDIVAFNARQMGIPLETFTGSSFDFLESTSEPIDVLYIDPARRDVQKRKVVRLKDLTPDLSPHWELLLQRSNRILLKLSPMMDIQEIVSEIPNVRSITLLSVRNELKEVVVEANRHGHEPIQWKTVEFPAEGDPISFQYFPDKEDPGVTSYAEPRLYLYEPLVGILKLGAFHQIGAAWGLAKLHPNTHLYTSYDLKLDFPGRIFEVKASFRPKPDLVGKELGKPIPANILVRNYGENGEDLAKKWHLKAKDAIQFLIFTQTIAHKKGVFLAHRLK